MSSRTAAGAPRSMKISPRFSPDQDSMFLATASADGQPYIQHRGGPKGFVKILDKNTLAFADYSGNRQYITQGNLTENPKAHIFVMDYAHRRRVKIWGEARVVDDDPALLKSLMPAGLQGTAGAGDPVQDFGMGHQLPAAHSAEIRRRRCRRGAGLARRADRGAGGGTGEVERPVSAREPDRAKPARWKCVGIAPSTRPAPARPAAPAVRIRRTGRGSPPRTTRRSI